jgi:multisubunit Na+/H+ antiporter MnhB subunit
MTAQREASHPLFYRVGSRRMRRRVVLAMYAGWVVIAAVVLVWSINSRGWFWAMEVVMMATTVFQIIWFVWLGRTYVNAPRLADAELDERLLQVKNKAYRRAYLLLAPVTVIAWILSLAALQWQPNDQGRIIATMLVVGIALIVGTLPTAIVAWQEPDPEPLGS